MNTVTSLFDTPIDNLKFDEIVSANRNFEKNNRIDHPTHILFLGNITIDPITEYFKYLGYQEDLPLNIRIGGYNNILQEIIQPEGCLQKVLPDVIILTIKMDHFNDKYANNFSSLKQDEIKYIKNELAGFIKTIIQEIRHRSNALILIHNFEVPVHTSLGILDYQKTTLEINSTREINQTLVELIANFQGTYIVDIENLKSMIGYENFIDNRNWYLTRLPYSHRALRLISKEYMKFIKAAKGKTKKCLVLDCDNTLWGGIIGEDGINNIQLGSSYPGSVYLDFQKSVLNLYNRGILLAICSKNNEPDVMEVFESHPYMILKKDHFVSMKINWNDKATNLKEIARDLNIGLDSIVLIDDNQFELDQVRQILPEVAVMKFTNLPGGLYKDLIYRSALFDTLSISKEDRLRSELYKADVNRNILKSKTKTMEEFFTDLEMEVSIRNADNFSIPRIAQLTQKTNQFNLTSRRYSESDISCFSQSDEWSVRYLELNDKFGNNGIVGVAILHFLKNSAVIDTFLLSCRIIGRTVETVFLTDCIEVARKKGYEKIIGIYIPTKKNMQVETFYPNLNFELTGKNGDTVCFQKIIRDFPIAYPEYFKIINRA